MGLFEIIIIAIGLSMDSFAVSIILGISIEKLKSREILIPGFYFGISEFLMAFIGYFAGINFSSQIQYLEHWVTFILLTFIGGKRIKDSFEKNKEKPDAFSLKFIKMSLLAIATSIDSLVIGITFSFFKINIFTATTIIGLTTFFISTCGVIIGRIFGTRFKSKAEFMGGFVLVALGIKILIEHLFF